MLYYGYTVDDNYLVPPFFIEVLSENLEKKIGLNSTINVEKSDYDIARETFDKNIIDSLIVFYRDRYCRSPQRYKGIKQNSS